LEVVSGKSRAINHARGRVGQYAGGGESMANEKDEEKLKV
jgi:hypothetical protein